MRILVAGLAVFAAACVAEVDENGESAPGGYTLEVRASSLDQTYLVTTPDGRVVGARAADGASALMNNDRALALAGEPPPRGETPPEVMSLRLPGFQMQINAEEESGDNGRVALSIGAKGQNIVVHADEGGPGEADDRAYVRITGADADSVRHFVEDAEGISLEVKAAMLAELGLGAVQPEEAQP